ncbi:MAG TPA: AMP-binding protein [Acidimicrobiia bacterium]|nr:AMP-binding protein [Acidimicrobiia bacterium]
MATPVPAHPTTFWGLVEQRAARTPDAVMLEDDRGRSMTFGEFRSRAEVVAAGLQDRGITAGSVVSWQLPTTMEAVLLLAALPRIDAVQNPIIPILREREVAYITGEAQSQLVIAPTEFRGFGHKAMLDAIAETRGFDVLACDHALPAGDPATLPPPPAYPDAASLPPRWLYHTSGSTADPKGVWHTDASVIAASYGMLEGYRFTADDVYPLAFPIAHIGGAAVLSAALSSGLRVVLIEIFDPERSPLVMAEHGATFLGSALPFFQAYLAAQRKHGPEPLFPRLRACVGGGAPNSPEVHREVQAVLGGRGVCSSWGLTEFPIATAPSIDDTDEQLSTTEGRPSPGVEVRVVRDGRKCAIGEEGELCLAGPQLFRGYANPELMEDAFDDHGHFRTGDLGVVLPSGHVKVTGRLKDVIIRNAENISATEVEDVLHGHPKILDVAVIGLPDARTGERACAVVELAEGVDALTLADVADYCRSIGVANQKIPEQLEIVDEVPRNPMGKIRKQELRDRYLR